MIGGKFNFNVFKFGGEKDVMKVLFKLFVFGENCFGVFDVDIFEINGCVVVK